MRILILSPSVYPEPGGLQRYTFNLAESAARNGHDVQLCTLASPEHFVCSYQNLVYAPVNRWASVEGGVLKQLWQKVYLLKMLDELVIRFRPDEMICTWWDPLGYLAALISRWRGIPYVCVGHGQEILQLSEDLHIRKIKRRLKQLAFNNADRVIAVSRFTKQCIVKVGVSQEQVKVVPNGLSPEFIKRASGFSQESARLMLGIDGHIILQVGRLVPRKGHELMFDALPIVRRNLGSPVSYVIVGSGPYMDILKKKVRALGLEKSVLFTGFVPDDRLHLYYSATDIVVMPSHNPERPGDVEGFGITYLEAYAHGKAVIGTSVGGVPDAILHEETGFLIPPGDSEILSRRIVDLLRDPSKAVMMGQHGQRLVQTRWNWDFLYREFLL